MNEPRSGNIYGGGGAGKKTEPAVPAGAAQMEQFIQAMVQRQRRQAIFLFAMTALALLAVGGMIYYWMDHNRQMNIPRDPTGIIRENARLAPVPYEDSLPLYLIDPLKQIKPAAVPNEPAPLTVDWVKQAVYHLLEAEKAAQESRFDVALAELANARKIYPQMKGMARMEGLIYLAEKDYAMAARTFELARQEEPPSFGILNNLGIAYIGLTNLPKAEAALLAVLQVDTNYALAYYNLAMIHQRQNDLPKAAEYLGRYTAMRPGDRTAAENYALLLIQVGQWDKAAGVLDELGDAIPQSAVIQFRLAQALSHVEGRRAQALNTLEHAVTLVDSRKALAWLARPDFDLLRNEERFKKLSDQLATKGAQ